MTPAEIKKLERELAKAELASEKAWKARASLPPGSTRARVTSANARWAIKAEHRDRLRTQLIEALEAATAAEESGNANGS